MGIYIHVPFCKSKCIYCDFYKVTDESYIDRWVDAICSEASLRGSDYNEPVKSIYLGGGTPSRLSARNFDKIFNALYKIFSIKPTSEITIEVNPDDLTDDYIQMLAEFPFNRLSIGVESFDDKELKLLSRRHTAEQAVNAIKKSQLQGFNNINIDLIYAIPGQTAEIWSQNLKQTTDLDIQHLSAYHLIYEKNTELYSMLKADKIRPVDEEVSLELFSLLISHMNQNSFIHYEISAFGKEEHFSQHNSSYWLGSKYIGLGPAAHSFDGDNRSWNVASLSRYLRDIESGSLNLEQEHLSLTDKYNEFILTGLRTIWGIDRVKLLSSFGEKLYQFCMENAEDYIKKGLIIIEGDIIKLNQEGIFISDRIISDLMWV